MEVYMKNNDSNKTEEFQMNLFSEILDYYFKFVRKYLWNTTRL